VFGAGAVLLFSGSTPGLVNRVDAASLRSVACPRALPFARQRGRVAVGAGARSVSPARRRLVHDHVAAVRRRPLSLLKGSITKRRSSSARRRRIDFGTQPLPQARLADRTALLAVLGHRGAVGAPERGVARAVRLPACALQQGPVVGIRVRLAGAEELRALLLAAMVAAAYALWRLLRPSKPPISARARRISSGPPC